MVLPWCSLLLKPQKYYITHLDGMLYLLIIQYKTQDLYSLAMVLYATTFM